MNNTTEYLIYQNGKPSHLLENQNDFKKILDFLDRNYKSREFWENNLIIRIYKAITYESNNETLIEISSVNKKGIDKKNSHPNWTINFSYKKIINIKAKLWDRKIQMKTIYVLWDCIRRKCNFDLDKEIKNIEFEVINSSGKQTQHSKLVEFFSKKENCNILLKYSEVTKMMTNIGLVMVGRGIEGERPREFRYAMGYEFITNDKDKSVPSKYCKVLSPFPTQNRNERRAANADLEKKDWSETFEILKKNTKQLRCFYCGRFEGETNRIGQKSIFQKGHLKSHSSEGDTSDNNIIEQCQYCNTFLSDYFDFDPDTLKATVNAEKAVEKTDYKTKIKILDNLLTKQIDKNNLEKILKKFLK